MTPPEDERPGERPDAVDAATEDLVRQTVGAVSHRLQESPTRDEVEERINWIERQFKFRWLLAGFLILLTTWFAVNMHQVFINQCVQPAWLSATRATVCDWMFFGDRDFSPGRQVSEKPAPPARNIHP